MAIQIGRKKQVPIYNETTTTVQDLSTSTIENYFTVTQGSSYGWNITGDSGFSLKPSNIGVNSSTATVTFTAVRDLSGLIIAGTYYTEQNYDKITLTVAGETILNTVSGVEGNADPTTGAITFTRFVDNKELKQGDTIVFQYVKNSSQSHTYESYTNFKIYNTLNYTTTTTEITGYEEKIFPQNISNLYLSPTKKVIGGWIKDSIAARQFYYNSVFQYTGNYTASTIAIGSTNYDLYTLTSTGVLTLPKEGQVWACGGGGGGANGFATSSAGTAYSGGGGGGGYVLEATTLQKGEYNVVIGAGGTASGSGGATSIGDYSANGGGGTKTGSSTTDNGSNGGSGGGMGCYKNNVGSGLGATGTGAGISTYPFGITDLKAHCAGGGGGSVYGKNGYDGGTNGSDGRGSSSSSSSSSSIYYGGVGGVYGGGNGGAGYPTTTYATDGSPATFYGSGGGGAGIAGRNTPFTAKSGGSGYQGVAYILIQK